MKNELAELTARVEQLENRLAELEAVSGPYEPPVKFDPAELPEGENGYTVTELAELFGASVKAVERFLSDVRNGRANRKASLYNVERVFNLPRAYGTRYRFVKK